MEHQERWEEEKNSRGMFHPYLIIEDSSMRSLRKESEWAYKEMSQELLEPLINEHRYWIYHLGVMRILLKLCQGYNSFKLDTSSFCYAADSALGLDINANNRYRFYPKGVATEKDKDATRHGYSIKKRPRLGSIARYIARDKFEEYERKVGRNDDPYLFLNYDFVADLKRSGEGGMEMEIKLREWQKNIIRDLSIGRDFILYPYGLSLHHTLSLITGRRGKYYSKFRLGRVI